MSPSERVRLTISHETDGPLTSYVLIFRAAKMIAKGECSAEEGAEGLFNAMTEAGYLEPDSDLVR